MSHCWPLLLCEEKLLSGQEFAAPYATENWRFLQVTSGVAYWLGKSAPCELRPGDLVAVAPHIDGAVRASQINDAALRHFCFNLPSSVGLFSLAERAEISRRPPAAALIFPGSHPAAQVVSQAPLPESPKTRLTSRANLLHAVLLVLAEHAPRTGEKLLGGAAARRFQRLTAEALDVSLLTHSTQQIAELCGCTRRHLNSLWHRELGCNLRSAQRELRLRMARELIEQGAENISDIARRVGFTSVSRFNAAFKRLFGCTPTECRAVVSKS